ncbi:hypothetical protein HK099_005580 [Clydaea vesicula]|uniref:Transcription initiation factor IIF subunit alpha n=1 Tax=Clydaea vesicula TaxID=447962 RepID=A0AAD5Y390_9FUNG|nr:hypothetical protein HK099_005580 [Clydaea vesicula]
MENNIVKAESQEYSIYSSEKTQVKHHLMKILGQDIKLSDFKDTDLRRKVIKKDESEEDLDEEGNKKEKKSFFKKKNKSFFFGRNKAYDENDPDDGISGLRRRAADPDILPWILKPNDKLEYEGNVEGAQSSQYVFFVLSDGHFNVVPAAKWYKFKAKASYQTFTTEEAEEKMSISKRGMKGEDLWMMKKFLKNKEDIGPDGIKLEDGNQVETKRKLKVTDADSFTSKKYKRPRDELAEELDFDNDEHFQDDDGLVDLGLDNQEETQEAAARLLGKNTLRDFEDEDFDIEEKKMTKAEKKIKKILKKQEAAELAKMGQEAYLSDDDELSSDDSEAELEKIREAEKLEKEKLASQEQSEDTSISKISLKRKDMDIEKKSGSPLPTGGPNLFHKKLKKNDGKSSPKSSSNSPKYISSQQLQQKNLPRESSPLRESSASPGHSAAAKFKVGGSMSPIPPPPSGAEVLKRERERRRLAKQGSQSPPQGSVSPQNIFYQGTQLSGQTSPQSNVSDPKSPPNYQNESLPPPAKQAKRPLIKVKQGTPSSPGTPATMVDSPTGSNGSSSSSRKKKSPGGNNATNEDPGEVLERAVLEYLRKNRDCQTKEMVQEIKPLLRSEEMKVKLKMIIKKVADHDPKTKCLSLKDQFK